MMFRGKGARTRRLLAYMERRGRTSPARRGALDCSTYPSLFHRHAVVYTDTADFTMRTARDGILHFLMVFNRAVVQAEPMLRRHAGRLIKVEADSLLMQFPDVDAACHGVDAMESLLQRLNRGRVADEQLCFSYGIGYGDMLDLEEDLFGLEVNLASKLGEDLAKPGEALLTPTAAAALSRTLLRRVVPYRIVTFGNVSLPVQRFKLRRR
jgi:class 3 adenylate cyclase